MTTANPPALRPECSRGHGPMVLIDPRTLSKESNWSGTWYECAHPFPRCRNTVLLESPELTAQLVEQANNLGTADTPFSRMYRKEA